MNGSSHKAGGARRWIVLVLALGLVAGACGGDDEDASPPPDTADGAADEGDGCTADRVGGDLTMGVGTETRGLDPTVSAGSGSAGGTELAALYDALMRWNPDTDEFEPRVAESLEPNDDYTEWTLTLRDGVVFGNGDPLTTDMVRRNIERQQDPETASPGRALSLNIVGMEVVDPLTMTFQLDESWASFPFLLSEGVGMIVNLDVVEARGRDQFNTDPSGAGVGPFEFVRWSPGEEIVLEAKDDYWGGPVCIEQLRFVAIPGAQATYEALRSGELDVALLGEAPAVAQARDDGVESYSSVIGGGTVIHINNGAGGATLPTSDVRVRQAIAYALDVDAIDQRVNSGQGLPTSALISEESRFYDGLEGPPYDPDRAIELLDEVKSETGWDGRLTLQCGDTPAATEQSIAVEAMLEAADFDIDVEQAAQPDLIQRVVFERNYEIACLGFGATDETPWVQLNRNFLSTSPFNYAGYADPDMDAALAELKAAVTDDDQKAALAEIQEVWNDTVPVEVLSAAERMIAWSDDVRGLDFTVTTIALFDKAYR